MSEVHQQTRRAVLRLAAGAAALLTGGLVLADPPEVSAEATGALDGKRGRHRGKRRRERKQTRRKRHRERSRARDSKGAKPASGPDHFIDVVEDSRRFAVASNDNHVIEVNTPVIGYPHATLGVGGWSIDGWSPQGQTLIDKGFAEWESATAPGFTLQRLGDTATHKRFLLTLVQGIFAGEVQRRAPRTHPG